MKLFLSRLKDAIPPDIRDSLSIRFRRESIRTVRDLAEFVRTRSAYVAQTSLYGYLKNRMGVRYPEMFSDETMAASIDLAKWRVYGSCLADLAIFAAASAGGDGRLDPQEASNLATHCLDDALAASFDGPEAKALTGEIRELFSDRLKATEWATVADGENAFRASPVDLVRHAPIADELKELDIDIVVNSTRFRWRDVRRQLRDRIDPAAVSTDWLRRSD